MANFGPLTAETGSGVWETPASFNWFRVLAALLQRRHFMSTSCVLLYWQRYGTAVQQRALAKLCGVVYKEWNYGTSAEGATYIRLGGHHVGHRPTF